MGQIVDMPERYTHAHAGAYLRSIGFRKLTDPDSQDHYLHPDGRQAGITYDYDQALRDGAIAKVPAVVNGAPIMAFGPLADGYYGVWISPNHMSQAYVNSTPTEES